MDRLLVLIRHGQSEWNVEGRFSGQRDVPLTQKGIDEARAAGRRLRAASIAFDAAYSSPLHRATETLRLALEELGQPDLPTHVDLALDERDYGDLTGLGHEEARARWGEEQVLHWRRGYADQPPGGESLRDTGARVWPYYLTRLLPGVMRGERTIVSAHGNSLRSLIMVLDRIAPEHMEQLELPTGIPLVYRLNPDTTVEEKRVLDG